MPLDEDPLRRTTIHATCLVVGEVGILVRGPSGSGKSTLARRLIETHGSAGGFARLVADDRVVLDVRGGRLIARPDPRLTGLLEIRGLGLMKVVCEPAAVVGLLVDLLAAPGPRLPDDDECRSDVLGIRLTRVATTIHDALDLVSWRIRGNGDTPVTKC